MGKFSFGKVSMKQLNTVHPLLKEVALAAIELSTVDFGVLPLGGRRNKTEQKKLFDQGFSKCDGTIKLSKHQDGTACDFVPYVDGKYTWDNNKAFYEMHTAITTAWNSMHRTDFELVWGGHWSTFLDLPHYELKKL